MLIDADTGIMLAIRVETLSHEFTAQLYRAIRMQAYTPFDEVVYNEYLKEIYEKYPNSKALLSRAIVRLKAIHDLLNDLYQHPIATENLTTALYFSTDTGCITARLMLGRQGPNGRDREQFMYTIPC